MVSIKAVGDHMVPYHIGDVTLPFWPIIFSIKKYYQFEIIPIRPIVRIGQSNNLTRLKPYHFERLLLQSN